MIPNSSYKKFIFSFILVISSIGHLYSQDKYWITFTDKDIQNYDYKLFLSEQAICNREREGQPLSQFSDAPVDTAYLQKLKKIGVAPVTTSRWFNAITAHLTSEQLMVVNDLDFVLGIEPCSHRLYPCSLLDVAPESYSKALDQLGAAFFTNSGLNGKGVSIGIIDAGFLDADSNTSFTHVYKRNGVKATFDFLLPERKDFYDKITRADYHGRKVWERIGGYVDSIDKATGIATEADYYLARTENGIKEYSIEEDAWVAAIEWMDQQGVRLVSTSLGYTNSFDDPLDNHLKSDMDGRTTKVARAAQMAVQEKGIFLVVAAGNEGNIDWEIISTPADAEGVLTVGACKRNYYLKEGYSSIGADFVNYIKPEVVCYSTGGTSYAAPSITGFVACLIQKSPDISNAELKKVMVQSAHLYPFPNNYVGYGVPNAKRALAVLDKQSKDYSLRKTTNKAEYLITCQHKPTITPTCFHKRDSVIVREQERLKVISRKKKGKRTKKERIVFRAERRRLRREGQYVAKKYFLVRVERKKGVSQTTVHVGEAVYEIIWR